MSEHEHSVTVCPSQEEWLHLVAGHRDRSDPLAEHPELQTHLDDCTACRAAVDEVRRYQTLLLRAKVPGLSPEQRENLDARVHLLAGQWSRPNRVGPRVAWGVAMAAAAAIAFLVAQPFLDRQSETERAFAERLSAATLSASDDPGPGIATGAVEGAIEVTDLAGRWRPMVTGEPLKAGMRLRSGKAHLAGSAGRVVVPGRFELRLLPETELEVLSMRPHEANVRLRQGEIDCQVDRLRAGQRFAVMFAGFRASVVGTRFTVRHSSASAGVAVQVSEGAVRVDAADEPSAPLAETTTTVRAGQQWLHAAGRMALEPIPVPDRSPLVDEPLAGARGEAQPAAAAEPAADAAAAQRQPARAATRKPARTGRTAKEPVQRSFVIEVPPQKMSEDEIRRLQQGGPVSAGSKR